MSKTNEQTSRSELEKENIKLTLLLEMLDPIETQINQNGIITRIDLKEMEYIIAELKTILSDYKENLKEQEANQNTQVLTIDRKFISWMNRKLKAIRKLNAIVSMETVHALDSGKILIYDRYFKLRSYLTDLIFDVQFEHNWEFKKLLLIKNESQ